jgi:hypothetical protein
VVAVGQKRRVSERLTLLGKIMTTIGEMLLSASKLIKNVHVNMYSLHYLELPCYLLLNGSCKISKNF